MYRYFLEIERKKENDTSEHDVEDTDNDYDLELNDTDDDNTDDTSDSDTDNADDTDNTDDTSDSDTDNADDTSDDSEHDVDDTDNNYDLEINDDNSPDNSTSNGDNDSNTADNSEQDNNYDIDNNDTGDDTSLDNTDSTEENNEDPDKGIKELEKTIGSLSEEQIKIQNITLKKQYIELYNNCTNILERLNDINKKNNTEEEINFGISSIQELKKLIYSYLVNTYDTKSYVQNTVNYTEYLVTLNSVNKLLKEINMKNNKK